MHFFESSLSIHHKLPHKQYSLQPHSEGESLPPFCALLVLIRTKEWRHPEESNMISKCKYTKQDGQETNFAQYPFLALLFQIQENTNTAVTMSKHNTSTCLPQEICSFYWQNKLSPKCPKRRQWPDMFAKNNVVCEIICFPAKFKCSPYSNSAIKIAIQPSELIKKTCTQVSHPWWMPSPWQNASTPNHFFGELPCSRDRKKSMPNYVHHQSHSIP